MAKLSLQARQVKALKDVRNLFRSGACFMRNASPACGVAEACGEQKSTAFRKPAILKGPSTLAGKIAVAGTHKAAPLHDPDAEDALVLNDAQWKASSDSTVPVVVDPCAHTSATAHPVLLDWLQECCKKKSHA